MMLIQSSLLSPTAAGLSSVCDCGQQEFSCVWIPGDLTWQGPTPVTEHKNTDDDSCSQEFLGCSSPSTKVNMSEASTFSFVYKRRKIQRNSSSVLPLSQNSSPTFVYKRRKVQKKPTAVFPAQVSNSTRASDSCFSADSSEAASVAGKEHMISLPEIDNEGLMPPNLVPVQSNRLDLASKLGSIDVALLQHEPMIEENPERRIQKALKLCAVNDNCSSSRSNMDLDSACLKLQVDDVDECSSSGALVMDSFEKGISEKNPCISFLRQHGVLERSLPIKTCRSEKQMAVRKNTYCLRPCKICNQSETTLKMLICDLCEESFHVSCCNPSTRKVSVDEWFCHSCLRKKLKKLKETNSRKSKDSLGPIAAMLRGVEPYTSNVRIGKDFQAEVPDWSGPIINDVNDYEESVEASPVECGSYQGWDSSKLSRLSSIGNWIQCREVINGDGTICGKWRRAPLFEVQTDDWECFRSVLWDPTHADCAVPQEMDTDQVLKHLKYIEMLRPRLAVKRCKLGVNKRVDSQ